MKLNLLAFQAHRAGLARVFCVFALLLLGSHGLAEDKDHDGIDASVDPNDFVPRYHISAGGTHSCALDDHGVHCWGGNTYGESDVPPLVHPRQVDAGGTFTCALDDTGVVCWGNNADGELDVPAGMVNVRQVSAGLKHACALHDAGVTCWGSNNYGERDDVPTLINPSLISAGGTHSCALDDEALKCWGDNSQNQSPTITYFNNSTGGVTGLATGRYHTCALGSLGIICWGSNSDGQRSVPASMDPRSSTPTSHPYRITAGDYQSCALDDNGATCWGRTLWAEALSTPPSMTRATDISAGSYQACALDDGNIHCWGNGVDARSGAHVLYDAPFPNAYYDFSEFPSSSLCAEYTGNQLLCFGSNAEGQLNIPSLTSPQHIHVGNRFACADDIDGIHCWGSTSFGTTTVPTLGSDASVYSIGGEYVCALDSGAPVCWGSDTGGRASPPSSITGTSSLTTGWNHACAWSTDSGSVQCWGDNSYGQAGSHALNTPTALSMGLYFTCALTADGVQCWGDSQDGRNNPPAVTNATQLASGSNHSCVLADGSVLCWGSDDAGQTDTPTLTHPREIALSGNTSCALDDTGVHCWGYSSGGLDQYPTGNNQRDLKVRGSTACVLADEGLQCWGEHALKQAFAQTSPTFADADGDQIPDSIDPGPFDPTVGGTLVANAGGPYTGVQGQPIETKCDSSYTDTSGVAITACLWDKSSADGVDFASPDANGSPASIVYATPGSYTLSLRVEDSIGRQADSATTVTVLADSDGDGIADVSDAFPAQGSASIDADGDGLPDDCSSDNACLDDGLTPDPSLNDFDNDGIKTDADSDDTVDTAPPTVIAPPDISIDATGSSTSVNLLQNGAASASDFPATVLTALPDTAGNATTVTLPSGHHLINWCATDSAGNNACDTQVVDIAPVQAAESGGGGGSGLLILMIGGLAGRLRRRA